VGHLRGDHRRSDWAPREQLDLGIVDNHNPRDVALAIELKYDPVRAGADIRGDTAKLPVCMAEEIERHIQQTMPCVAEGR
jgi:hypothetical protein